MQIEHWAILFFLLWASVVALFIWVCKKSDDQIIKDIENDYNKNKTVIFLDDNPLQWEDVDFQRGLQPTVDSYKSLN